MVPFNAKLIGVSMRRALFLFSMFVSTVQTFRFTGFMSCCLVNVVAAPKRNDWGLKFADIKSFVQY